MASSRPMSDRVSCVVCMEQYNRTDHIPKQLPCQHTFCLACLLSLKHDSSSMVIQCPMCRSLNKGSPHDFTTNRMAIDIAEKLQQQASPSPSFRSQQASPSLSCSAHADIESVLVCVNCLAGVCAKCVKKHKHHQLEDLDDAKTLLRERFVDATRKQQSLLKMASAAPVGEITRAEDDIRDMCALLISVITEWQNDQLSIVGEIKTKAAKREQEMKAQNATLEAKLQNDYTISTLIRHIRNKETVFCQSPQGNTKSYNFVTARKTLLADLTSVITSENLVNSKFLQDQTPKVTSIAMSPNQRSQQKPARQIPAGASPARRDNQGRNVFRNIGQQQPKEPGYVRKEKLQAVIRDNREVPVYWTKNTNHWTDSYYLGSTTDDTLVHVDAKTYAAVERLVKGSCVQKFVGEAAASVGLSHSNIQVQEVQRIENPYTYQRYCTGLKRACQEALKCDYPAITSIDNEQEVLTATLNIPELEAIRLGEVNEYLLFCGVPKDKIEDVVMEYNKYFMGLYLSESSTKADQKQDTPTARARAGGPLYMVVCRAILGHIYHQKGSATCKRPPCRDRGCRDDQCSHHDRYDSVMRTEKDLRVRLNFREFKLSKEFQLYPEFLVTYTRI